MVSNTRISGTIVETEAYSGVVDTASHAFVGRTPRNAPMWGAAGHTYIYLIYGMYWLFNITCEPEDQPAAVLIRAVQPITGHTLIQQHRGTDKASQWTNGPGKWTRAFAITSEQNLLDITQANDQLWIEVGDSVPDAQIVRSARVGLGKNVDEPWRSALLRWHIRANPFVSHHRG
jgi:DNA-3-methyladenine glycosylase